MADKELSTVSTGPCGGVGLSGKKHNDRIVDLSSNNQGQLVSEFDIFSGGSLISMHTAKAL